MTQPAKHELHTFADVLNLYAELRPDRRDVMLDEVIRDLRYAAEMRIVIGERLEAVSHVWVDDDAVTPA